MWTIILSRGNTLPIAVLVDRSVNINHPEIPTQEYKKLPLLYSERIAIKIESTT